MWVTTNTGINMWAFDRRKWETKVIKIERNPLTVMHNPIYDIAETKMLRILRHTGHRDGITTAPNGYALVSEIYEKVKPAIDVEIRNMWEDRAKYTHFSERFYARCHEGGS